MYKIKSIKQQEEFGELFLPRTSSMFIPRLSNHKKEKIIMEIRSEERKLPTFSDEKCNCFHLNDTIDHGINITCKYHKSKQKIDSLKSELDPYKLKQLREQRLWIMKMNANRNRHRLLKISPILLFMVLVASSLFFLI